MCGDLKNNLDLLLIGDIPCLKNLIILITVIASFLSLGASIKLKLKFLKLGPLKSNSMFGFITAPVVLVSNRDAPEADPAIAVANPFFTSPLLLVIAVIESPTRVVTAL